MAQFEIGRKHLGMVPLLLLDDLDKLDEEEATFHLSRFRPNFLLLSDTLCVTAAAHNPLNYRRWLNSNALTSKIWVKL